MEEGIVADFVSESPLLVIAFGGIAKGVGGMPPLEFLRTLEAGPAAKRLFLRDHQAAWYHRGVHGFADDIDGIEAGMRRTIADLRPRRVVMLGASAGGYAALLFGRLLGATEVHAFGPQTFLTPELRRRHGDDRWAPLLTDLTSSGRFQNEYGDLDDLFRRTPAVDSRFVIHYCATHRLDSIHALHLSWDPTVELRRYEAGDHTVVKHLRDSGELTRLIAELPGPSNRSSVLGAMVSGGSEEDHGLAVVRPLYELMALRIAKELRGQRGAEARLRGAVSACFAVAREHRAWMQEACYSGHGGALFARTRTRHQEPVVEVLRGVLEEERDLGGISNVEPHRVARQLMGIVHGALAEACLRDDVEIITAIEATTADQFVFWGGVRNAPTVEGQSGLADVFPSICERLREGDQFAFSRFGNGELHTIARYAGRLTRRDLPRPTAAHEYFPDLGQRLHDVLSRSPDYLIGVMPLWFVRLRKELYELAGDCHWVSAVNFRDAVVSGRFGNFFDALTHRNVVLVGPAHLRPLAKHLSWSQVEIPARDCWLRYAEIRDAALSKLDPPGSVLLCTASMVSNILIDELYMSDTDHTYLDVGSALDPYAGVKSRPYHKMVDRLV